MRRFRTVRLVEKAVGNEAVGLGNSGSRNPPGSLPLYRVGSSPTWRLGKKLLGVYLPWRFGSGKPFHAGLPWRGMELGLKVMSQLLAA